MNTQVPATTPRRTRGRPRADPQDDQWYGIQDARERKRRQDRLAQRARRERVKSGGTLASTSANSGSSTSYDPTESRLHLDASNSPEGGVELWRRGNERLLGSSKSHADIDFETPSGGIAPDYLLLTLAAHSLYAALVDHGNALGLKPAECQRLVKSSRANAGVPASLQPTPLQLTTPHLPWIDRFPFARMRDNMIILRDVINLDSFCGELFSGHNFHLEQGKPSWDPRSWNIDPEYSTKWGFLLY